MLNTLLFMGNEVVGWIMANVPVTGVIVAVAWMTWTISRAVNRFDKEIVSLHHRIDKVEVRLDGVEKRLDKLEQKFEKLEEKVEKLSGKFDLLLEELRANRK